MQHRDVAHALYITVSHILPRAVQDVFAMRRRLIQTHAGGGHPRTSGRSLEWCSLLSCPQLATRATTKSIWQVKQGNGMKVPRACNIMQLRIMDTSYCFNFHRRLAVILPQSIADVECLLMCWALPGLSENSWTPHVAILQVRRHKTSWMCILETILRTICKSCILPRQVVFFCWKFVAWGMGSDKAVCGTPGRCVLKGRFTAFGRATQIDYVLFEIRTTLCSRSSLIPSLPWKSLNTRAAYSSRWMWPMEDTHPWPSPRHAIHSSSFGSQSTTLKKILNWKQAASKRCRGSGRKQLIRS